MYGIDGVKFSQTERTYRIMYKKKKRTCRVEYFNNRRALYSDPTDSALKVAISLLIPQIQSLQAFRETYKLHAQTWHLKLNEKVSYVD